MPDLTDRRSALRTVTTVAAGMAWPALWAPSTWAQDRLRLTPSQTEGPFYPDVALADADADLLRHGSADYALGEVAWVSGTVVDQAGKPVSGAEVEIWQCDHDGLYRHSRSSGQRAMEFQGFGKTQVGADGGYRFRTIKPLPYPGRTPHIHVKVKLGRKELLTTQLYVAGDTRNSADFLVRRLSGDERRLLEVPFHRVTEGWQARFPIVVAA